MVVGSTLVELDARRRMPKHSIIIPAYNEGARLGVTLDRVLRHVAADDWDAEVIVVNDGSHDNTAELVRAHAARNSRLRLLENPGNRGKGYSVRNGMLSASGDMLLFSDADLSAPIEQAAKLFEAIAAGFDVAVGSRWLEPALQAQRQSLARQLYGRSFNLVLRILLGLKYKDTQCGFKAFSRRAAHRLPLALVAEADLIYAMTPQGLLAGLSGIAPNQVWEATRIRG